MEADRLSANIWNAIVELVKREQTVSEITFGKVTKRDLNNKVIWVEEFGETAIPLVAFDQGFSYYDTNQAGSVVKKYDPTDSDPAYKTKLLVPRVGQMAVVLNKWGNQRFPVCLGVIQSIAGSYWKGEE